VRDEKSNQIFSFARKVSTDSGASERVAVFLRTWLQAQEFAVSQERDNPERFDWTMPNF
jgi:hypothetical protein